MASRPSACVSDFGREYVFAEPAQRFQKHPFKLRWITLLIHTAALGWLKKWMSQKKVLPAQSTPQSHNLELSNRHKITTLMFGSPLESCKPPELWCVCVILDYQCVVRATQSGLGSLSLSMGLHSFYCPLPHQPPLPMTPKAARLSL